MSVHYLPARVHTSRHYTPHARVRHVATRIARSEFAEDVRSRLPMIPQAIGGAFAAYLLVLLIRGLYVVALMAGVAR